ncbi:calcium-binding protein [uncultured Sphingomonas sp.]|uniref:calcium-binding protein n=1 Tax=uncultured Sphingomonas sp. TaxID=158754 RepID=UPI0025FAAADE|nr:calcium-binding protein [uncultured Sphingomonas sp.]
MNLAPPTYWSTGEPFIDRVKTGGEWRPGSGQSTVTTDKNGDPLGIPSGTQSIYKMVAIDPAGEAPIDTYVVTWQGKGTFSLPGTKILSQDDNRLTFQVTDPDAVSVQLKLTGLNKSDPVHDVHLVRTDQVDLFNAGEIFNPAFVEKASGWDVLRFKDWANIDGNPSVSWADRAQLTDSSWSTIVNKDGVPLEAMVQLSNESGADMWWNVAAKADDTYVKNALTYIRDHLDPGITLHVEYGNEVWNGDYGGTAYANDRAKALWGKDADGDGKTDGIHAGNLIFNGYRSAQVAKIVDQVFGSSSETRVDMVLGGQLGNDGVLNVEQQGVQKAGGTVAGLFDSYAVTTYFGGELSVSGRDASDQAKVLQWARGGKAGMDAAFKELQYGGSLDSDSSLTKQLAKFKSAEAIAEKAGVHLVAYEGGAHLTAAAFPSSVRGEVVDFFARLMNDPRMEQLYAKMADGFAAAGGTSLVNYNDIGQAATYGYWGVLDNVYDTSSPRYDALRDSLDASHKVINGTSGNNVLTATRASDTIQGGAGNDDITGSSGSRDSHGNLVEQDYYYGGTGSDTIKGGSGDDHIFGNSVTSATGAADGNDRLNGNGGDDYIQGNAGSDTIQGGAGNDRLFGGMDSDSVMGGTGRDTIVGGQGRDLLTGNSEADLFVFSDDSSVYTRSGSGAYLGDVVADFANGVDHVALGFDVSKVLHGTASSAADAAATATHLLTEGGTGVAAISVGSDTYLFYDGAGAGAADSSIAFRNVNTNAFDTSDFV